MVFKHHVAKHQGEKFAWLDPTTIYINGDAFHDLLNDLVSDLENVTFDVIAGLDAMGFVLGSALATRLGIGFLPIRKAGKLCVDTDSVTFSNYSGRTQDMEMRKPAFAAGTKVLLVDQWIETGGTMDGAIRFSSNGSKKGGKVAGLVARSPWKIIKKPLVKQKLPTKISMLVTAVLPDCQISNNSATVRVWIALQTMNRQWRSQKSGKTKTMAASVETNLFNPDTRIMIPLL